MGQYANLLYQLFPIIITEKGENTRRVRENQNPEVKNKGISYSITEYDIEDGSNRAVVFAILGIKKVECFVGKGLQDSSPPQESRTDGP